MTTTWDPTTTDFEWTLSNANLTATVTTNGAHTLLGTTSVAANATQDVTYSVHITSYVGVAVGVGLATASHAAGQNLGDYQSVGVTAGGYVQYPTSTAQFNYGANFASSLGSGQTIYVRVKNGFAYFAESSSGPWIGVANPADPNAGTGGVDLSVFSGAQLLPALFAYDSGNAFTADFTNWDQAGSVSTSPSDWIVDPHDFGAYGDAATGSDGVVSGGNTLSAASYTFTSADVGKWLYLDPTQRQITAASGGAATFTPGDAALNTATGVTAYWLAGHDDTDAIAQAISHAATVNGNAINVTTPPAFGYYAGLQQGATVQLRSGHAYMVSNPSASGKPGCIVLPPRIGFRGAGAGAYTTSINVAPNSVGHVICNESPGNSSYVDFLTIADLILFCNANWSSGQGDGVHLEISLGDYAKVDACNRIRNIHVYAAKQSGFYLRGRGESFFEDLTASLCGQYGFNITALEDSIFVRINAGGCGYSGIKIESSACQFVACKSFNNGGAAGSDAGNASNWRLTADDPRNGGAVLDNCVSQDAQGSSWVIESGLNILNGCLAVMPALPGAQSFTTAGFHLTGENCRMNTFSGCAVMSDWPAGWGWHAGDAVHIEGTTGNGGPQANRGSIYTQVQTTNSDGSTLAGIPYASGSGPLGGTGASNGKNTLLSVDGVACT